MIYVAAAILIAVIGAGAIAVRSRAASVPRSSTEPHVSDVTVVFTNIIDFVGLFEHEGDERAVEIVNLYRATMTPIIRRGGGYLNKFIGDKMLILFNTPINPDREHYISAVKTVLLMQDALDDLNARLEKSKHSRIAMSIGVASGHAVVGDSGPSAFADYTAMGDVVNIAARLEQACKKVGRRNLISLETASRLADRITLIAVALAPDPLAPALAYEAVAFVKEVGR